MPDFLLFNVGNTHTQWCRAARDRGEWESVAVCDTAQWMAQLELLPEIDEYTSVWVACVVPAARGRLAERYQDKLHWVNAESAQKAGLDWRLMDTSTLGADRIANAAALLSYPLPAVNFDCGTAITMETVLADGTFAGGAIAPGRKLLRRALSEGTAALPEAEWRDDVPEELGVNTQQAMQLGIDRGAVGTVRELMAAADKFGVQSWLVSGGDAEFFAKALDKLQIAEKTFTLRGVWQIALKS